MILAWTIKNFILTANAPLHKKFKKLKNKHIHIIYRSQYKYILSTTDKVSHFASTNPITIIICSVHSTEVRKFIE